MTINDSDEQHGFHRHGENAFIAEFSESEREVLINLVIHHLMMKSYYVYYQMLMPIK